MNLGRRLDGVFQKALKDGRSGGIRTRDPYPPRKEPPKFLNDFSSIRSLLSRFVSARFTAILDEDWPRPLSCQGCSLPKSIEFSSTTDAAGHVSFITSSYTPWASVGQISNPVAKASKVETGMAEGIKPLVRRNNRQTGLRVGGMARTMQGESHLLSGLTGRRDAHPSLPGEAA